MTAKSTTAILTIQAHAHSQEGGNFKILVAQMSCGAYGRTNIAGVCAIAPSEEKDLNTPNARRVLITLLVCLSFILQGCGGGGGSQPARNPGDPAEWTVLVFLNADNDLERFGILNMNQMETVGSTDLVNIVVQMDRGPGHDTSNGDWTDTRRYLVKKDGDTSTINSELVENIGEVDMGDPDTLRQFIEWGKERYPAKRYALIMWNHGRGWFSTRSSALQQENIMTKAISYDQTSGSEMRVSDLPVGLETSPRLDLVAFDACRMQMVEVLYEMRNSAKIILGSEEDVPGDGYPYHRWLGRLIASPTMSAEALGYAIVSEFAAVYQSYDVTQSAVSTDALADVVTASSQLAEALTPYAASMASQLASARNSAQSYVEPSFKDIVDYAQRVNLAVNDPSVQSATQAVTEAVHRAVIAEAHSGTSVQRSHGLSIWVPTPTQYTERRSSYAGLEFSRNSTWDEWLASQKQ